MACPLDSVTFTKPIERDVYLSYIAHSLILGPNSREEALCGQSKYPLCVDHISEYYLDDVSDWHNEEFFSEGLLRWCATQTEMVPLDDRLFRLLGVNEYMVFGSLGYRGPEGEEELRHSHIPIALRDATCAALHWFGVGLVGGYGGDSGLDDVSPMTIAYLDKLLSEGITATGCEIDKASIMVQASGEVDCDNLVRTAADGDSGRAEEVKWKKRSSGFRGAERILGCKSVYRGSKRLTNALKQLHKSPWLNILDELNENTDYVGWFAIRSYEKRPASMLATLWNETIGERGIPFEPNDRGRVVTDARQHPELRTHIEKWEAIRDGAK